MAGVSFDCASASGGEGDRRECSGAWLRACRGKCREVVGESVCAVGSVAEWRMRWADCWDSWGMGRVMEWWIGWEGNGAGGKNEKYRSWTRVGFVMRGFSWSDGWVEADVTE